MRIRLGLATAILGLLSACSTTQERGVANSTDKHEVLKQLAFWETEGNAAAKRSSAQFTLEHYEIPAELIAKDFSSRLDPKTRQAFVFTRNGQTFVRWPINHEDSKWHLEVEKWLQSKGASIERHRYFKAYMTASRSYLIEDPETGAMFSAKVSTNVTGGAWKDKKVDLGDTREVRMMSEYIDDIQDRVHFDRLRFLPEPMSLGIEDIDQAVAVRSLDPIVNGDSYLLPLFSALHENVGREIAELNGSTDPKEFWRQHLVGPLAEAYAELAAHFGMTYDSPHGQNFMIELDAKKRPTGRIYFKDFGDAYLQAGHFNATDNAGILTKFTSDNVHHGRLQVAIGLGHGNQLPAWLTGTDYQSYNVTFFEHFDRKFSSITGVPEAKLTATYLSNSSSSYAYKQYALDADWDSFLKNAPCAQGKVSRHKCMDELQKRLRIDPRFLPDPQPCEDILSEILMRTSTDGVPH